MNEQLMMQLATKAVKDLARIADALENRKVEVPYVAMTVDQAGEIADLKNAGKALIGAVEALGADDDELFDNAMEYAKEVFNK